MSLRILMIAEDAGYIQGEKELLREKDVYIYTCNDYNLITEMIDEIKPSLLFINPKISDTITASIYNELLDRKDYMAMPIIYTLSEDDIYIVNQKRTIAGERRYMICDNALDALKTALTTIADQSGYFIPRHPLPHSAVLVHN